MQTEKQFWRLLRSFEVQTASKYYDCKRCNKIIEPGDPYTGYIYVSIEHHLITEREHYFCEPDDPWEDEDWERDTLKDFEEKYPAESQRIPDISPARHSPERKAA